MKIISQNEFQHLSFKSRGNAKFLGTFKENPIKDELDKLNIGEMLLIEKNEWYRKSEPPQCINGWWTNKGSKKLFSTRSLKNEEGWIVTRIR